VRRNYLHSNLSLLGLTILLRYFADYCQPESGFYDEAGSLNTYPKRSDFEKFVKENAKFKAFAASLA